MANDHVHPVFASILNGWVGIDSLTPAQIAEDQLASEASHV